MNWQLFYSLDTWAQIATIVGTVIVVLGLIYTGGKKLLRRDDQPQFVLNPGKSTPGGIIRPTNQEVGDVIHRRYGTGLPQTEQEMRPMYSSGPRWGGILILILIIAGSIAIYFEAPIISPIFEKLKEWIPSYSG